VNELTREELTERLYAVKEQRDRLLRAAERVLAMPIAAYAPKMLEPSRGAFAELAAAAAAAAVAGGPVPVTLAVTATVTPTGLVGTVCPDCGAVNVLANVFESGRAVAGLCPGCGDQLHFAAAPPEWTEGRTP
jgi:hypothetical protein